MSTENEQNKPATTAPVVADISPKRPLKNASMEANPSGDHIKEPDEGATAKELREAAIEEGKRYQVLCAKHEDNADKASWALIRLMLRVVETFEMPDDTFDEAGFQQFLTDNGARPRPNAGSDLHRLAKACTPRGMKSSRISKIGGAINALRRREIRSSNVFAELNKRESIKEGGPLHFGAHRFFLLYREDKKEQDDGNKDEEDSGNPYKSWPRPKLVREGKLLLEALSLEGLIPSEYDGLEAHLEELSEE